MFTKYFATTSLIAAMALTPIASAPAQAQVDDARGLIGGLLLGGAILGGIAASQQPPRVIRPAPQPPQAAPAPQSPRAAPAPQRPRPQATYNPPRPSIPATEAGRQVQTALNYFGFDAGYVDGQVGRATRAAVERYQAALGYPVNGRSFPEPQAQYLIGAYLWATNGGAGQTGLSGAPLLVAYREVLNGNGGNGGPVVAGQPGGTTTVIVNPATTTVVPTPGSAQPVTTASSSGTPVVPNLFAGASDAPVLSSRCDAVALQGQANGGMMTLGNLSNPGFALSEQFCTARASAVNQGHDLTEAIAGMTYEQITVQCQGFSEAIATQTSLVGVVSPQQATAATQGFAITTGIPTPELAATARVCLGVGYGSDDMAMAMGSALILVATGEPAYGELLGHHLREGYGLEADAHRAHEWYDASLNALIAGAPAVFSPSDAGRLPLIRQAVAVTFGAPLAPTPTAVQPQVPVIPGAASFAPQVVAPAPTPAPTLAPTPAPQQVAGTQPAPVIAPRVVPTPAPSGNEPTIEPFLVQEPDIGVSSLPTFEVQQ
ncbi:peptidoglycan-binding domain-containing protein [Gymnodinialimonas ulvae]|uniref:peptidoglycan-binding domain-containing protein n=1 Tax=Gymnodinialimonas ulvae TaxID=3126504 RepID=UPI00309728B5